MAHTILLYGATGYTGRLIASELRLRAQESHNGFNIILAGRRGEDVKSLAANLGFDARVFCLGVDQLWLNLRDVNVTINAAGPFAATARPLALAALAAGSHYLDINGEPDVYYDLTDLDQSAALAQRAILSGCGFWAGASNILLDNALRKFLAVENAAKIGLGAVRIAASRIAGSSRGSAATLLRSIREQSVVARKSYVNGARGEREAKLELWAEPVGKIERRFDFGPAGGRGGTQVVASLVSLVDTLAAVQTLTHYGLTADTVESYVEMEFVRRALYQAGSLVAPWLQVAVVQGLARRATSFLSTGPTQGGRDQNRHVVLLELEDGWRRRVIDWRLETPNVYQFTAQLVAGATIALAVGSFKGFRTPADVLGPAPLTPSAVGDVMRGCSFTDRGARPRTEAARRVSTSS
jgi:short subunit dehydrogenase-like uncharacterized protein